jgi:hypothetical protein
MRRRPRGARRSSVRRAIDRIAARAPVRKLLFVEALGHARVPFAGYRPDHRAGVELAAIDAHRAAEAVADLGWSTRRWCCARGAAFILKLLTVRNSCACCSTVCCSVTTNMQLSVCTFSTAWPLTGRTLGILYQIKTLSNSVGELARFACVCPNKVRPANTICFCRWGYRRERKQYYGCDQCAIFYIGHETLRCITSASTPVVRLRSD